MRDYYTVVASARIMRYRWDAERGAHVEDLEHSLAMEQRVLLDPVILDSALPPDALIDHLMGQLTAELGRTVKGALR